MAADLDTWLRLLGLHDQEGLAGAEIDTRRHRLYAVSAKIVRHARQRTLRLTATWPWAAAFALCWKRIGALAPHADLTETPTPTTRRREEHQRH